MILGKNYYKNDSNVFQYKLLIIPSNQDNHKSIFVVICLQNVGKHGQRLGTRDHTCILHLETGKSVLKNCLAAVTAHNIRLLLNKLYRGQFNAGKDSQSIQFKINANQATKK